MKMLDEAMRCSSTPSQREPILTKHGATRIPGAARASAINFPVSRREPIMVCVSLPQVAVF